MRSPLVSVRFWFQIALTGGFLGLLAWRVNIGDALATLPQANWAWVLPGLVGFTLSKAIHTARWRIFLGAHRKLPFSGLLGIFLIHNMANAVLLLRAGDLLRIQTTSQRYGISRSELTATVIVVETLLDGLTFVLLVAIAFSLGAIPDVLRATFWAMAGLALLGLALGVAGARWGGPELLERVYPLRWLSHDVRESLKVIVEQFVEGLRTLRESRLAAPAVALSLAGWLLEAVSYWFFGQAFGLHLGFSAYLLIMMTANFAVAVPVTPSGIGPYEVATQELIVLLGAERALATGFAIGIHLCFIIWITLTGLAAMWLMRLSPSEIFYLAQTREDEPRPQPEAP
ncbi:MAG: hypothetical protein A2148_07915 [Chloroflexi bacterium RBG_16_68_14]|nr:MAG: hypothetical protein A2148_07915 [Chloroflexi bacterium RBG_16_68_14]